MNDLRQLVLLEQQALEYYKDGDYSGVVCTLVKAIEGVGLHTSVVPRDKSYAVYVAENPITVQGLLEYMEGAVVRVYKVGTMQRAFEVLMGSSRPTYHVSAVSGGSTQGLMGQPCTIVEAVATVQACFE